MISVYLLNADILSNDKLFDKYYSDCSIFRRKLIDRFVQKKDKLLSLGASVLLDFGLKKIGRREKDMTYMVSKNGKPSFENLPDVYFSISHSESYVMVAFSDDEIGCDIEKIGDIDLKIAKRYFTKSENAIFIGCKNVQKKVKNFFRLWTLKESYIKNIGVGLNIPLNSFNVELNNDVPYIISENGTKFNFCEINLDGYKCSVCYKNNCEINVENVEL